MSEPARRAFEAIAENTSRRGFLARVGAALTAATAGSLVAKAVEPAEAERFYGFCGHTYTTHACPHPGKGPPRIDARGYPMRGGPFPGCGQACVV